MVSVCANFRRGLIRPRRSGRSGRRLRLIASAMSAMELRSVVAETLAQASDAAERIEVDYEAFLPLHR